MTTQAQQRDAQQATARERAQIAGLVKSASTSFYGAMRVLPRQQREAIFAVYAFCRAVDDVADDEGASQYERLTALEHWRSDIDDLYNHQPGTLITRALGGPVQNFDLNKSDFLAVIDGMEMDARGPIVAPEADTLSLYCDRVASAVGRLCVCIFGEPGVNGIAVAKHLGLALQLANILRDVGEDAEIGRLYLPGERLREHGISFKQPSDVLSHRNYGALWLDVAGDAHEAFAAAELALGKCNARKMRPARIMLEVYKRNLDRMCALSDAQLGDMAVSKRLVGKAEKIMIALRYGLF